MALTPVRNLAHLNRDRGYRWQDHVDPVLEFIRNDITDSGWPLKYVAERAGVAVSTLRGWQSGKTAHPQNQTVEAVLTALGWRRPIVGTSARRRLAKRRAT